MCQAQYESMLVVNHPQIHVSKSHNEINHGFQTERFQKFMIFKFRTKDVQHKFEGQKWTCLQNEEHPEKRNGMCCTFETEGAGAVKTLVVVALLYLDVCFSHAGTDTSRPKSFPSLKPPEQIKPQITRPP